MNLEQDNLRGALAFASEIGDHESEATLLVALSAGHYALRGFMGGSRPLLEGVLEHPLPDAQRSEVLATLTLVAYSQNDVAGALEAGRRAVEVARRAGDPVVLGRALNAHGEALSAVGDLDAADRCLLELDGLPREGLSGLQNVALVNRGYIALMRGDAAAARSLLENALERTPRFAVGLHNLGLVALHEARTGEALELFAATLRVAQTFGLAGLIAYAIDGIAAAIAGDEPLAAARLYAAADEERRAHGLTYEHIPYERDLRERTDAAIQEALADDELAEARSEGAQLGLERTVARALELAARDGDPLRPDPIVGTGARWS